MPIIISYPSALEFYLKAIPVSAVLDKKPINTMVTDLSSIWHLTTNKNEVKKILYNSGFSFPVSLLTESKKDFRRSTLCTSRLLNKNLPPNSYIKVNDNLYVMSPECCFLYAAKDLPLHKLVTLANNLCSIYVLADNNFHQKSRKKITSVESISKYLSHAEGMCGYAKSHTAISYALNNSNSPMESKIATIMVLPLRYGGFAIPAPTLNKIIKLYESIKRKFNADEFMCDMVWEFMKIILEYDSDLSHLDSVQHKIDKMRSTSLNACGYKVFSMTKSDLSSLAALDNFMCILMKNLKFYPKYDRMEHFKKKRNEVFHDLFKSQADDKLVSQFC